MDRLRDLRVPIARVRVSIDCGILPHTWKNEASIFHRCAFNEFCGVRRSMSCSPDTRQKIFHLRKNQSSTFLFSFAFCADYGSIALNRSHCRTCQCPPPPERSDVALFRPRWLGRRTPKLHGQFASPSFTRYTCRARTRVNSRTINNITKN